MIARRDFLKAGAALSVSAVTASAIHFSHAAGSTNAFAFFDRNMPDGQRFALLAEQIGMDRRDTGRDMAALLYGEMRDWTEREGTLFLGVTRYADFTVASGIARENGRSMLAAVQRREGPEDLQWLRGEPGALARAALKNGLQTAHLETPEHLLGAPGSILWAMA
ncbi:hypothetical protein [Altericroceibacterium endophyticum]|uniref:Twin-arginine translocation signal domain-containing protein n=1 Tax=Altericroceibacterium endophyticum TaxID=1808508 RepID=A0A6I4T7L6_9SPHN|nr:hypothetical protein [Altericroceibacterium endophyticum]MXO66827.1 hypothetical protein [Altericroceibacterium endophyticum]